MVLKKMPCYSVSSARKMLHDRRTQEWVLVSESTIEALFWHLMPKIRKNCLEFTGNDIFILVITELMSSLQSGLLIINNILFGESYS